MNTALDTSRTLQNRAALGVGLMLLGLALYPLSDAFIKHLMGTYSVHQSSFLRSITRVIPLFIATFFQGGPRKVFYSAHPLRHSVRLGVNLAYTYCFMFAFSLCSLTNIYTLSYTSPFFMIILGALMLKERVSIDRWLAVGVGMIGVIIAMRPGSNVFEMASLIILLGTFLGALNKILMRRLASNDHSLAIAIYPNLTMILVAGTLVLFFYPWKPMPWSHWGLFGIVGAITAAGQYAIAQALRFTSASTLAPVDYSSYFWVVALDFFWWGKSPELFVILGAALIVGSNLFILYKTRQEAALKKQSAS
jgi:drug/metabolite transporter (DMT)-like permease